MPEADITLYTAATMNGWKPLIFLEESGLNYSLEPIDFSARTHKTPAFLALNPNGKNKCCTPGGWRLVGSGFKVPNDGITNTKHGLTSAGF